MPDRVRKAAYAALRRRESGIPVADIAFDSVMEAGGTLEPGRRMRFEAASCAVELVISAESEHLAWELAVSPAGSYDLVIRSDGGKSWPISTDEDGKARVPRAPRGVISLLVSPAGSDTPIARTAWVPL